MKHYEFDLLLGHFRLGCRLRFPEDISRDCETLSLFASEVRRDEIAVGAAKVVDVVCAILTDVDLAIRVRDHIYDIHG